MHPCTKGQLKWRSKHVSHIFMTQAYSTGKATQQCEGSNYFHTTAFKPTQCFKYQLNKDFCTSCWQTPRVHSTQGRFTKTKQKARRDTAHHFSNYLHFFWRILYTSTWPNKRILKMWLIHFRGRLGYMRLHRNPQMVIATPLLPQKHLARAHNYLVQTNYPSSTIF